MNIKRPEYTGDWPLTIGGGDIVELVNPQGFRRSPAEYFRIRHAEGNSWRCDTVTLDFENKVIVTGIENYTVWKGCVALVKRSRMAEFFKNGHNPSFRTEKEVEEYRKKSRK